MDLAINEVLATAILSNSVGLAGLLLVFLGFIISSYQSYDASTSRDILKPYKIIATIALAIFVFSVISGLLSLLWLLKYTSLEFLVIPTFALSLLGVLVVGVISVIEIMRR